jgi:predicted dehydrogenase
MTPETDPVHGHEGQPRRIRLGMVGGGQGAFIGGVHRMAARLDDAFELVAGAFSSDPARARESARAAWLAPGRCYTDWREMARAEAARNDRIDVVAIVTPNHLHVPVASAFASAGIDVICDKPLGISLAEARDFARLAREKNILFCLTHNYSGYPAVRHARELVARGALGEIRVVQVEYAQDWLTGSLAGQDNRQADWRDDPERAGPAGALGDIATHAFHLVAFVTGMRPDMLAADLATFVPGRRLDDNVQAMLRFPNGARGALWASQVAPGNANGLRLRVYGSQAGLSFDQQRPDTLGFTPFGEPEQRLVRGSAAMGPAARHASRIPAGHPEGYIEAFAQLYQDFAEQWRARREHRAPDPLAMRLPGLDDALQGMAFIDAVLRSARTGGAWVAPEPVDT